MMSGGGKREHWTKMVLLRMHSRGLITPSDWGYVSRRLMRKKVDDLKWLFKRFAIPKGGSHV